MSEELLMAAGVVLWALTVVMAYFNGKWTGERDELRAHSSCHRRGQTAHYDTRALLTSEDSQEEKR